MLSAPAAVVAWAIRYDAAREQYFADKTTQIISAFETAPVLEAFLVLIVIFDSKVWMNQFGWDGRGIRTLLHLPISPRELLLGKMLGLTRFVGLQSLIGVPPLLFISIPSLGGIAGEEEGLKIIARDKTRTPLLSRWIWTEQAIERVLRVPKGFMRDRTQARIEELAADRGASEISLELVEEGIEIGLQLMKEMISGYGAQAPASEKKPDAGEQAAECPVPASEGGGKVAASPSNGSRQPLNEVSIMSELDKRRQGLGRADA